MKSFPVVATLLAVTFITANSWARGGGNSSSAAPVAHSGSAPAAASASAPHVTGGQHSLSGTQGRYSGKMPYRPMVTYRNGNKTLIYPAVRGSTIQPSTHSNSSLANKARTIRRSKPMLQNSSANLQRSAGNFQRGSGNLRTTSANSQRVGNSRIRGNSQHAAAVSIHSKSRLDPQTSARMRNWRGNVSSTAQAHQNHWNNCHHHHGHDWWHNHCIAFIFWDWGWWGWWDGWWYPAWGYDPYSYYGYNEPIYAYGDLSPEQIVASVQVALQQEGYYQYAIDGQMGPMTRSAIGRYQRDNHLSITYGIDPATLGSLGIIR